MTYKELRSKANELNDKVEEARNYAHYEIQRLGADLSYSGEENRTPADTILAQMDKAKYALETYIHLCEEHAALMEKEIIVNDNGVA